MAAHLGWFLGHGANLRHHLEELRLWQSQGSDPGLRPRPKAVNQIMQMRHTGEAAGACHVPASV